MNTAAKQEIIARARAHADEEVCGILYCADGKVHVHHCANVSPRDENGEPTFQIDDQDYITADLAATRGRGRVCGIYHSHIRGGAAFSEEDIARADTLELPFFLYSVVTGEWASYIPLGYRINPIGREFAWGEADCYETIRLHFRQDKGVYLTDYDRDETLVENDPEAIVKHIEEEGFEWVPDGSPIRKDDVFLFKTNGSSHVRHLGVFVGHTRMLHHPLGGLSTIEPISPAWMRRRIGILRYVGKVAKEATS